MNTNWHFPFMVLFSLLIFFAVIRIVLSGKEFMIKRKTIILLSFVVVVIGMIMGKYGAMIELPWWIYYPVPMLMTVLLPPLMLKLNRRKTGLYLLLSFLSAPFIHFIFSFFLGWNEYMPFWKIPSLTTWMS
jgi:hypothetical protein